MFRGLRLFLTFQAFYFEQLRHCNRSVIHNKHANIIFGDFIIKLGHMDCINWLPINIFTIIGLWRWFKIFEFVVCIYFIINNNFCVLFCIFLGVVRQLSLMCMLGRLRFRLCSKSFLKISSNFLWVKMLIHRFVFESFAELHW